MRTLFIILFLLIVAGESINAENSDKTVIQTPLTEQNLSPEAIFDQIKGFLTVPAPNLNIQVPAMEMQNFNASGIQNLNDQIRDIAGVDIFQFLQFLWNIFLVLMRYILDLLPRAAG